MKKEFEFKEGSMWEGYPIKICLDYECSSFGGHPCRHCHSEREITHVRPHDNSTYTERVWICPIVVIAENEGQCNSTGVCVDCIMEALETIKKEKLKKV